MLACTSPGLCLPPSPHEHVLAVQAHPGTRQDYTMLLMPLTLMCQAQHMRYMHFLCKLA